MELLPTELIELIMVNYNTPKFGLCSKTLNLLLEEKKYKIIYQNMKMIVGKNNRTVCSYYNGVIIFLKTTCTGGSYIYKYDPVRKESYNIRVKYMKSPFHSMNEKSYLGRLEIIKDETTVTYITQFNLNFHLSVLNGDFGITIYYDKDEYDCFFFLKNFDKNGFSNNYERYIRYVISITSWNIDDYN